MNKGIELPKIYNGEGDRLMQELQHPQRVLLLPDALPSKEADVSGHIRIQWGQHLLDDLVSGRYRSFICAVNAEDNSRGIISQLAKQLPTSQWTNESIANWVRPFAREDKATVVKLDMDMVEVLALVRPTNRDHFTLDDIGRGFRVASEMIRSKPNRMPTASVSFLGAHANKLLDENGQEPTFEAVLQTMHETGFTGDVYPSLWMWELAPTAVFARYPFPESLEQMRAGGF